MHPRLETFFRGAVTELMGAYGKSEGAPSACKGSLRERGVRRAIEHSLPGMVRLYEGEIIDSFGGQTGQLDGILVHASGSALATAPDESRIVLAEGAIAVVESKSNLPAQWKEVVGTWDKVRAIRRCPPGAAIQDGLSLVVPEPGLPFYVIGRKGWTSEDKLLEKVVGLAECSGNEKAPFVLAVQLEPPGFGYSATDEDGTQRTAKIYREEKRWCALTFMWIQLTEQIDRAHRIPINWGGYLGY